MNEVYIMLFEICLTNEKRLLMKNAISDLNHILTKRNKFYTILKILAVKNKIKKRKMVFNKIDNAIKGKVAAYLQGREVFIFDGYAGADKKYTKKLW